MIKLVNEGHRHFVLDLSFVPFLDSMGLGVVVAVTKRIREHDGSLRIASASGRIAKVFDISGLREAYEIHSTPEEATRHALDRQPCALATPVKLRNTHRRCTCREPRPHRSRGVFACVEDGAEALALPYVEAGCLLRVSERDGQPPERTSVGDALVGPDRLYGPRPVRAFGPGRGGVAAYDQVAVPSRHRGRVQQQPQPPQHIPREHRTLRHRRVAHQGRPTADSNRSPRPGRSLRQKETRVLLGPVSHRRTRPGLTTLPCSEPRPR